MTIDQLSIYLEKKEGGLATLTAALARENIDIRAMAVADTQDFHILRLIVSNSERATEVLQQAGCAVSVTQVLAVAIPDAPGSLAKVSQIFADNDISIEYMYAFITRRHEAAYVVFRLNDHSTAAEVLVRNGFKLAATEDINAL